MVGDQAQGPPRVRFIAANSFSYVRPHQNDHHDPPRPNDVDMRRRVVVRVDDNPQPADAKDRWHTSPYQKPKHLGKCISLKGATSRQTTPSCQPLASFAPPGAGLWPFRAGLPQDCGHPGRLLRETALLSCVASAQEQHRETVNDTSDRDCWSHSASAGNDARACSGTGSAELIARASRWQWGLSGRSGAQGLPARLSGRFPPSAAPGQPLQ